MKLTSRSEYALLAMIYLNRHDSADYITAETISRAQDIPLSFLEQILLALRRAHYVLSSKGQHGGFRLAKEPEEISLAEIIRLFDGALAPTESVSEYFYESTPIEREEKLVSTFRTIRDYVAKTLEETTLADVT
jgi:Rrf2 family transcriptional regulator, cysteine metabolism repressor